MFKYLDELGLLRLKEQREQLCRSVSYVADGRVCGTADVIKELREPWTASPARDQFG
jgi:hypothetical protein